MRTNFKFALMSAAALLSLGLASCSSNDEATPENLTSDGKAVKTQFSIDFAGNVMKTRMTAETVQAGEQVSDFRGMDNIVLIPFSAQGDANQDPVLANALPLGKQIALKNMLKPTETAVTNSIPANTSGLTTTKGNAVLYKDVEIPLSTGSFLFYGKAKDTGTEKFVNGALTATINDTQTPANYSFTHEKIYTSGTSAIGTALAEYVTAIANATGWDAVTEAQNAGLYDLYQQFISLKAGSSRDVQAAVEDLYQSLYKNTDAISTAIVTAIKTKANVPDPANGTITSFDSSLGTVGALSATSEDATYPGDLNIPDGAALLSWDASAKKFEQKLDGATANIGTNITGKFTDYVYPASLYYVANSGVVTATTSQQASYDGSKEWEGILAGYGAGKSVKASSKSVAIVDQIQYAVGRLDTKVTAADGTLYDSKGDAVVGTDADRFPITGVLIGGQKPVDYMFHPATGTDVTIYDNIHKANNGTFPKATTSGSDYNYTLALETAPETSVYVAIEFLNNSGQDFFGVDGLVPAGGKFYLVAKLDPTSSEAGNADATGKRVFMQDFKTIANFTIGQGTADTNNDGKSDTPAGLANAYNVIPDLRTPKLELGLSVNLKWQAGITFTHTF